MRHDLATALDSAVKMAKTEIVSMVEHSMQDIFDVSVIPVVHCLRGGLIEVSVANAAGRFALQWSYSLHV